MNTKSYEIIINGKSYDVEVIAKDGRAQVSSIQESMVRPVASAPAAPAAAPASAPAPKAAPVKKSAPVAAGDKVIAAPLPGTVLSVNCKVGDKVKANTVLFVLEAMKMENEIFAGVDGVVKQVNAAKGQAIETGATLAVLG